jgi:hypothetical protein
MVITICHSPAGRLLLHEVRRGRDHRPPPWVSGK